MKLKDLIGEKIAVKVSKEQFEKVLDECRKQDIKLLGKEKEYIDAYNNGNNHFSLRNKRLQIDGCEWYSISYYEFIDASEIDELKENNMKYKIKCVGTAGDWFIVGKVYNVVNNFLIDEDGTSYHGENINDFNNSLTSKFELVKENNMYFKKEDLKPMMVMKLRDESIVLVHEHKGGLVFTNIDGDGYTEPSDYEHGLLKDEECPEFEPIEIYEPKYPHSLSVLLDEKSLEDYNLIWKEQPKQTEVTMDEAFEIIANAKGVSKENIRIKE